MVGRSQQIATGCFCVLHWKWHAALFFPIWFHIRFYVSCCFLRHHKDPRCVPYRFYLFEPALESNEKRLFFFDLNQQLKLAALCYVECYHWSTSNSELNALIIQRSFQKTRGERCYSDRDVDRLRSNYLVFHHQLPIVVWETAFRHRQRRIETLQLDYSIVPSSYLFCFFVLFDICDIWWNCRDGRPAGWLERKVVDNCLNSRSRWWERETGWKMLHDIGIIECRWKRQWKQTVATHTHTNKTKRRHRSFFQWNRVSAGTDCWSSSRTKKLLLRKNKK